MKLTGKIHQLRIDFEISIAPTKKVLRFVNVLFIFGEKITLIDTGIKGSENAIFDYIEKQGREIKEIETIILSHSHPDHIGSASKIKEITGCKIIAHNDEQEWIENIEEQNRQRPVPGFFELVDRPVKIDKLILDDSADLKLQDDVTLRIIKSPGHSKGMLNILFIEDRILFTADSIPLKNDIPNYDNYLELLLSFEKIEKNQEYEILLTSWTEPLSKRTEIEKLIADGKTYMRKIDEAVKKYYAEKSVETLESCSLVVKELGLPPFLINPIVDRAFRSHLNF